MTGTLPPRARDAGGAGVDPQHRCGGSGVEHEFDPTVVVATGGGPGSQGPPASAAGGRVVLPDRQRREHDGDAAAREVAALGDPSVAALAPRRAADLYGLEIIGVSYRDIASDSRAFILGSAKAALISWLSRFTRDRGALAGANTPTQLSQL